MAELLGKFATIGANGRKSTSPGDNMFTRFRAVWPKVNQLIDYSNLNNLNLRTFDWNRWRGTEVGKRALEVKKYMKAAMINGTFVRGDHLHAVQFVLLYLGVKVKAGVTLRFPDLAGVSNARFLQRALYFILIGLLIEMPEVRRLYSLVERKRIGRLQLFCALYYAPYFLETPIASR